MVKNAKELHQKNTTKSAIWLKAGTCLKAVQAAVTIERKIFALIAEIS